MRIETIYALGFIAILVGSGLILNNWDRIWLFFTGRPWAVDNSRSGSRPRADSTLAKVLAHDDNRVKVDLCFTGAVEHFNCRQYHAAELQLRSGLALARSCQLLDLPVAAEMYNLRGCILFDRGLIKAALRNHEAASIIMGKWAFGGSAPYANMAHDYAENVRKCRERLNS